jgi:chemotaxis protein methyltransferase CheR
MSAHAHPEQHPETLAERLELEAFLEALFRGYGVDFRSYARSSLRRRVRECLRLFHLPSVSALQERALRDRETMERVLSLLCVNVTSMFRDPTFFVAFREKVVPRLRALPFVRVWSAGCATGEEAWSLAIVLHEAGLYERCRIYATDLSAGALERARAAVYPAELVREYTANYLRAGGEAALSDYYVARYDSVVVKGFLARNVVFAQHDLVQDEAFNEFDVVLCRNVLIYFDPPTAGVVLRRLAGALRPGGALVLGPVELPLATAGELEWLHLGGATLLRRPG